jgi:tetratricopeptide (TPR) repeat protein
MAESQPLRIFVAMPGTDMGPKAAYKNPETVKRNLLQPVAEELKARLRRDVTLVIEKEKSDSVPIFASMFAEARDAEVYIADLTGANPNVYLELGVRWALRDRVTVLITQSVEDLKFNVLTNRAVLYQPDTIIDAIKNVAAAIENGLRSEKPDNVVRLNARVVTIPMSTLDDLRAEIDRLQKARGEDLLRAARSAENLADRIRLLKQAAEANPASVDAFLELGKAYRGLGQYDNAAETLTQARKLAPGSSEIHRELGVTYSKQGKPDLAAASLEDALKLSPSDPEAWSNLGGTLRRIGMSGAPERYDKEALLKSRNSYNRAHELNQFDLYAGLNVARLDLVLSKWDPGRKNLAKEEFTNQVDLCRFMAKKTPEDYWRRFDLADALLFSGDYQGAHSAYDDAIDLVPADRRRDVFGSVLGPLRDYITAGVLDSEVLEEVKKVIAKLGG